MGSHLNRLGQWCIERLGYWVTLALIVMLLVVAICVIIGHFAASHDGARMAHWWQLRSHSSDPQSHQPIP